MKDKTLMILLGIFIILVIIGILLFTKQITDLTLYKICYDNDFEISYCKWYRNY